MRSTDEWLAERWRSLRTATLPMLALRVAVLVAGALAVGALGNLASLWVLILLAMVLASAVLPDSAAPGVFTASALVVWVVMGRHTPLALVVFTLGIAGVHAAAVLASRGPLQARVGRRSLAARQWAGWAGLSAAGCLLVAGTGWLTRGGVPGGVVTMGAAGLAVVAAAIGVLVLARPRR